MQEQGETFLTLINELQIVEKLERSTLEQFCKVFKVDDSSMDINNLNRKLKSKIADILITEADSYKDYLSLRKFSSLNPRDTERMFAIFQEIWRAYELMKKKAQWSISEKQLEDMIPPFKQWKQMERFHFKLFNLYKTSNLRNPTSSDHNNESRKQDASKPVMENPFMGYPPMGYNGAPLGQPPMYPPPYFFPFSAPPPPAAMSAPPSNNYQAKIEESDDKPQFISSNQNLRGEEKREILPPQMPYPPQLGNYFQPPNLGFPDEYRNRFKDQIENQKKKRGPKKREPQNESKFLNSLSKFNKSTTEIQSQFSKYQFIQCVCQANPPALLSQVVSCQRCNYSYHLKCLNLEAKGLSMEICPLCKLRKGSIITKVTYQPIKMSWFHNQKGKKLSIQLTDDEIRKLREAKEKHLDTRLRFLKIDGSSLINRPNNQNQYDHPPAKHNDIDLPPLSLSSQPFKIQISIRPDEQDLKTSKLYFFAIFIVEVFTIDAIAKAYMDDVFNAEKMDFYDKFRGESGSVRINLRDEFDRIFFFPVRGDSCDHLQVFDLKGAIEIAMDMRKQNFKNHQCPICQKNCESFKVETLAWAHIRDAIPELEDSNICAITIEKDGKWTWVHQEDIDLLRDDQEEQEEEEGKIHEE